MNDEYEGLRLCYVEDQWAWFTDQPIDRQRGDDWNDAPYEHNAGHPYTSHGERVVRVAFLADLVTPEHGHVNSPYSVQDINAGAVAWLRSPEWSDGCVTIRAGASFSEFVDAVRLAGGSVFTPLP